jgi:murein tripeptide amidase MpaA
VTAVDELAALLARVPEYSGFLGPDAIASETARLCRDFPGLTRQDVVGHSAEGRPIELLTVGHGARPILLLGVPHPNEPIGTLTALFLARLLCEDEALRVRLGITLWIVPVADPDGLALQLLVVHEGALVTHAVAAEPAAPRAGSAVARQLVEAAVTREG